MSKYWGGKEKAYSLPGKSHVGQGLHVLIVLDFLFVIDTDCRAKVYQLVRVPNMVGRAVDRSATFP